MNEPNTKKKKLQEFHIIDIGRTIGGFWCLAGLGIHIQPIEN